MNGEAAPTHIFETLHAAEQVSRRLNALILGLGPKFQETKFYTRDRVKSYSSIIGKLFKHQREEVDYSFSKLDDIVGYRIVTLYDTQLTDALQLVLHAIDLGRQLEQPLFSGDSVWDAIKTARFYRRVRAPITSSQRRTTIPLHQIQDVYEACRDLIWQKIEGEYGRHGRKTRETKAKFQLLQPSADTYSSAHIYVTANSYSHSGSIEIPVEIQLRTAAEDVWAEINHKLYYKVEDQRVWSLDIQELLNDLDDDSRGLKDRLEALPDAIARFRRHSDTVVERIGSFRTNANTASNKSYVIWLLYRVAGRLVAEIAPDLDGYDGILGNLPSVGSAADGVQLLDRCRGLLHQLTENFARLMREFSPGSVEHRVCLQCVPLVEFELTRLDILELSHFAPARTPADFEAVFSPQLQALSQFERRDEALVQPTTVIEYWKYIVTKQYTRPLALRHLDRSYKEMSTDPTLPEWSIYRILIPRARAEELQRNIEEALGVHRFEVPNPTPETLDSPGFRYILEDLREAMRHALDAYERSRVPDPRRGDLLFGFEPEKDTIDSHNIITLYHIATQLFGKNVFSEITEDYIKNVSEHMNVAAEHHGIPEQVRDKIKALLRSLASVFDPVLEISPDHTGNANATDLEPGNNGIISSAETKS